MSPTPSQKPQRTGSRRSAQDRQRAVLAAGLLLAVLAATLSDGRLFSSLTGAPPPRQAPQAPAGQASAGSLLIAPAHGNVCRQRLIDNATWQIRDNGFVICDEAVSDGARRPGARIEAIRDGFVSKR